MKRLGRIRSSSVAVALAIVLVLALSGVQAEVLPLGLKIEKVLDSSVAVGDLAQAPTGELWILERGGTIRVYEDGLERASLSLAVSTLGDGGLLDVAFDPAYATNGRALVSLVDTSGRLRIDEVVLGAGGLTAGATVFDVGPVTGDVRPGGGLSAGADGKLYVATGDLGVPADAQNDAALAGKVLRLDWDGAVPADNPSGTAVWAKGFRDAVDLAIHPGTTRPEGTIYLADRGESNSAHDEVNAVAPGGDHGWSAHTGPGGGFVDPLVAHSPTIAAEAVAALAGTTLGATSEGSVLYACVGADDVQQILLSGADLDQVDGTRTFYDPDGDRDGTPDTTCPDGVGALAHGRDGQVYAAAAGANPGIWRVWRDLPGAHEVSAAGSPFPLTVAKSGSDVVLGWEHLGTIDAGRPTRHGGQRVETYTVWEGALADVALMDAQRVADTDGAPDGPARRTATVSPAVGDRYFLVSAQGDNREGPLGADRALGEDWCDAIGWGIGMGSCAERWLDPLDPTQELRLIDKNPNSPTFDQALTMSDFRGRVVRMDISSDNCFWCNVQAGYLPALDAELRDRDLTIVTVFTESYGGVTAFATIEACATAAAAWAGEEDEAPILCDVDRDGDGHGDVSWQYWHSSGFPAPEDCGGTPQNFYIDQGSVIYDFVCGAELSTPNMRDNVIGEVNPETCE
jgi:glucose/arabinose dehydrogenase